MNLQIGDILTHILARSSYFYEPLNQTGFGPKSADLIAASLGGSESVADKDNTAQIPDIHCTHHLE